MYLPEYVLDLLPQIDQEKLLEILQKKKRTLSFGGDFVVFDSLLVPDVFYVFIDFVAYAQYPLTIGGVKDSIDDSLELVRYYMIRNRLP